MKKILVFGSNGLVGSSVIGKLSQQKNYDLIASTRKDTNLHDFKETNEKIDKSQPDIIINCAATVGGILANDLYRTEFLINNLKININIFESLINRNNIKLINLGSSCIYPLNAENPIKEESLMTGKLEPTNSPYAMAKLTGIELGDSLKKQCGPKILNLMPTNLYGPNDNFSENKSHVIPGLIKRMHSAKINSYSEFKIWGSGTPLREFLYVDDLADAIIFLLEKEVDEGLYNVGSNQEVSINSLTHTIKDIIGFNGKISNDLTKPDGNPRKLLDSSKLLELGWKPKTSLEQGLHKTYEWFLENTKH